MGIGANGYSCAGDQHADEALAFRALGGRRSLRRQSRTDIKGGPYALASEAVAVTRRRLEGDASSRAIASVWSCSLQADVARGKLVAEPPGTEAYAGGSAAT